MRGLGAFQMAQMKHRDARVSALAQHLRAAVDLWEEIQHMPFQKPDPAAKPRSEEAALPSPPPLPKELPPQKLTYTLKEAAAALGVSRSTLYTAIAERRLSAVKLGNRTLIPTDVLRTWLDGLPVRKK